MICIWCELKGNRIYRKFVRNEEDLNDVTQSSLSLLEDRRLKQEHGWMFWPHQSQSQSPDPASYDISTLAPPQLSSGRRPRPWQRPSHFRAVDEDDAMMTLSLQDDVTKIEMSGETDIQRWRIYEAVFELIMSLAKYQRAEKETQDEYKTWWGALCGGHRCGPGMSPGDCLEPGRANLSPVSHSSHSSQA